MSLTINHQTNDISATSGSVTLDGSAVGGGGGAMTFISTTELSSSATSVSFTGLDNTYPVYKLFYNYEKSSTSAQYLMWKGAISGSAVSNIYSYHLLVHASEDQDYGNSYTGSLCQNNDGLLVSGELTFYGIGESNTPIIAHGHGIVGDRSSEPYMNNQLHAGMGEAQTGTWNGIELVTFFAGGAQAGAKFSLYGIKDS